ncbi:MAG: putative baseplate assembly protein [Patulibacter minatonensis]
MRLPELPERVTPDVLSHVRLDDRTFQSLVDEARRRIAESCPEWTEHNVSDPGITLIELFAWMTEVLLYRVNQLPERLQVAMLELLGTPARPPEPATAEVRFDLSPDAPLPMQIPERCEVATGDGRGVVFATVAERVIAPVALDVLALEHAAGGARTVRVSRGVAEVGAGGIAAFSTPPRPGDGILLGFKQDIAGLVLECSFGVVEASGVSIDPLRPPLQWFASTDGGRWEEATVLHDGTGGLNYATGSVRLQVPRSAAAFTRADSHRWWLRCGVVEPAEGARAYGASPRLTRLEVRACGALVRAEHSVLVADELLGHSDGTPGQRFRLHHAPVMALAGESECLEVEDPTRPPEDRWIAWEHRLDLSSSGPRDRHYKLNVATGEIEFGPAVHDAREWRQYGAIPPVGVAIRMRGYRYGGGTAGNVEAGSISVLHTALPGVAAVTNPERTAGGAAARTLSMLRADASKELRTRQRAVTAGDFETLLALHVGGVRRSLCQPTDTPGAARVYVLPAVGPEALRAGVDARQATAGTELLEHVRDFLEERMLIGSSVHISAVPLRVAIAAVEVRVAQGVDLRTVEAALTRALGRFINPYDGGDDGVGWSWGRALHVGELAPIVDAVPGVEAVEFIRLYEADPVTGHPIGDRLAKLSLEPNELLVSGRHVARAVRA